MIKHGAWIVWLALSGCDGERAPYGDTAVPTDRLANAEAKARGRALFVEKCALCHGERADGRGVRKRGLSGAPANFRSASWRRRTTPRQVYDVIRKGKQGTSMPAWPTFTDDETWDLVAYLLGVSEEAP